MKSEVRNDATLIFQNYTNTCELTLNSVCIHLAIIRWHARLDLSPQSSSNFQHLPRRTRANAQVSASLLSFINTIMNCVRCTRPVSRT